MGKRTTTVEVDERGRLTIPKPIRNALDIDGERTTAEITIRVEEDDDE